MSANAETCGTCQHWHALAANPLALNERRGECREGPPHVTTLPSERGPMAISNYPNLPAGFQACGRHKARIALVVNDG